jgi:hypothetical protein
MWEKVLVGCCVASDISASNAGGDSITQCGSDQANKVH